MNKDQFYNAIATGSLRKYCLSKAQVGDKVLGYDLGEVIALWRNQVVVGWDTCTNISTYCSFQTPEIYWAPLLWVEDKPVYPGDVLYRVSDRSVYQKTVRGLSEDGKFLRFDKGSWAIEGSDSTLSWTDPRIMVEGKVLSVGDTLFSRNGKKLTVTGFEGSVIISKQGDTPEYWTADFLTWDIPVTFININGYDVPAP